MSQSVSLNECLTLHHNGSLHPDDFSFWLLCVVMRTLTFVFFRLSMLQGRAVPHWPDVWLCGHLHAVLQREGDGHPAECGGICGHRPWHWDPVWPGDHVGP